MQAGFNPRLAQATAQGALPDRIAWISGFEKLLVYTTVYLNTTRKRLNPGYKPWHEE